MEIKKLMNRRGSIKEIMIIIAIGIGMFMMYFMFIAEQANNSGVEIDQRFNQSYVRLAEQQTEIETLTTDLRDAVNKTKEATIGDYAFFGLRGILEIMKLPLTLMNVASISFETVFGDFSFLPQQIKTTGMIVALIIIIFAIIKFLTSRGTDA